VHDVHHQHTHDSSDPAGEPTRTHEHNRCDTRTRMPDMHHTR
jgi:hypothetical protein